MELPASLSSRWRSDPACPFGSCEFNVPNPTPDLMGDGSGSDLLSCKRGLFALPHPREPCRSHPGAEFCVRSDEATYDGRVTGSGSQVRHGRSRGRLALGREAITSSHEEAPGGVETRLFFRKH